jgi:hypothetical protein
MANDAGTSHQVEGRDTLEERERAGVITVWFGIIVVAASIIADLAGLGEGRALGNIQTAGIILGITAIVVGLYLVFKD